MRLRQVELPAVVYFRHVQVEHVLAELEEYGIIRKIKRGRGNILILAKKP